jgi:hypothetical protein
VEESQSSSGSTVPEATAPEQTDDEDDSSENPKPKTKNLDSLVNVARDQLRMARAEGAGAPLDQIHTPDREIVVQILGTFSDYSDFQAWLEGTINRGLARKSKSATWGLYATDARNEAEDIRLKRESEELRERDRQIELDRRQQAEAERARAMDVPVSVAAAAALVERAIPGPLMARLLREGGLISANALAGQIAGWEPCPACHDAGTLGSAIDSDLGFCECAAGVEVRYRDGSDWPARETRRVHAGAKPLLLAACQELGMPFTSDGLEAAEIGDDGEVLRIEVPAPYAICLTERDVMRILERVGWTRTVRIIEPGAARPAETLETPGNGNPQPITQVDIDAALAARRAVKSAEAPLASPAGFLWAFTPDDIALLIREHGVAA